jgi:hypothetical protein
LPLLLYIIYVLGQMRVTVVFTKEDLFNNYLFVASKSPVVKQKRRRVQIILTVCCAVCALVSFFAEDEFLMWYCIIAGLFFLLVYPFVQGLMYKRNFSKHAAERFESLKDVAFDYEITNEFFSTKSSIGDVVIKTSQIENITETKDYFFVRLLSKDTLTLPKHSFDYNLLFAQLNEIATANGIHIIKELDWRWK